MITTGAPQTGCYIVANYLKNKTKKNISLLICGNTNYPVMFSVVTNEMLTSSLLVLVIIVELELGIRYNLTYRYDGEQEGIKPV